jgi:hypothetical protein
MAGAKRSTYTCNDYREEMILLGLQRRLNRGDLTEEEKKQILKDIEVIEKQMGL